MTGKDFGLPESYHNWRYKEDNGTWIDDRTRFNLSNAIRHAKTWKGWDVVIRRESDGAIVWTSEQ